MLSNSIKGNLDILMNSETKLDSTFPSNQFTIEGCAGRIRFDRDRRGGGILPYIREEHILQRATYLLILVLLGNL